MTMKKNTSVPKQRKYNLLLFSIQSQDVPNMDIVFPVWYSASKS